jgi:hypothetical protein
VTVDKGRLAERLAGPAPTRTVGVFLFADALAAAVDIETPRDQLAKPQPNKTVL